MKKYLVSLTAVLCLLLTACGLMSKTEDLSDEEVVNTLVQALQQGDYEGIKPYVSDDNPLHQLFANTDEAVAETWLRCTKPVWKRRKTSPAPPRQ